MIRRQRDVEPAGAEAPCGGGPCSRDRGTQGRVRESLQMNHEDPGDGPAFSEMIRRQRDVEPTGAEAAAAEAPVAEIEAREGMADAEIAAARRMAEGMAAEEEAAEGRMLETRIPRKVRPPWLPSPTAACASSI